MSVLVKLLSYFLDISFFFRNKKIIEITLAIIIIALSICPIVINPIRLPRWASGSLTNSTRNLNNPYKPIHDQKTIPDFLAFRNKIYEMKKSKTPSKNAS